MAGVLFLPFSALWSSPVLLRYCALFACAYLTSVNQALAGKRAFLPVHHYGAITWFWDGIVVNKVKACIFILFKRYK